MAVDLTTLFDQLGQIFGAIDDANDALGNGDLTAGGLKSLGDRVGDIATEYASAQTDLVSGGADIGGLSLYGQRDALRGVLDGWKGYLVNLAATTIVETVHDDATLVSKSLPDALVELIRQMIGSGTIYNPDNDLDANTISAPSVATVTGVVNGGNGALVLGTLRPDGRTNEHILSEVMDWICTADQFTTSNASLKYSEPWSGFGEVPASSPLAWDAPKGSGARVELTSVSPTLDAQATGNLLTNSDWETWASASAAPSNWIATASAPSFNTDLLRNGSVTYRGTYSLEMKGLASGKGVKQLLNDSSGSPVVLEPNAAYALSFFAKDSGAGLLAGAVRVDLVDASETQLTDDAGAAIEKIVAAATTTASFANYSLAFVTPKTLPAAYYLRVSASTNLTAGESLYVADLCLARMTAVYAGGPTAALFSGSSAWVKGDRLTATLANNKAGLFQEKFQDCFNMRSLGLQMPSDGGGTETIADYTQV